jgi:oligopeptide/dipeptide ABC transporter ATP-binding protein
MTEALLEAIDVTVSFRTKLGNLRALDGATLSVAEGRTVALVGESGSGKTTLANAIMGLVKATGTIRFEGQETGALRGAALKAARRRLGIVFQSPYASLDPRWTAGEIVAEPLRAHGIARGEALARRVSGLLESVGLEPSAAQRFPRQFSGGQRQRIAIARALALEPRLLILDEPVSALDVSVQAQIVALLKDIQARTGVAYLLIAHDLALVQSISDRVAVMYLGRIVEEGPAREVIARPKHPYTAALVSASPSIADALAPVPVSRIVLSGEPPSAITPPPGCAFHPRCPAAQGICRATRPDLLQAAPGWRAACYFPGTLRPRAEAGQSRGDVHDR